MCQHNETKYDFNEYEQLHLDFKPITSCQENHHHQVGFLMKIRDDIIITKLEVQLVI